MQSLLILGRQSSIGLSELESLYTSAKVRPIGKLAAMVDVDPCLLAFDRLGGSIKFCKVLAELPTNDWSVIEKYLVDNGPGQSRKMDPGKLQLGISVYGYNLNPKQITRTAVNLKQAIRETGRGVRVIPNKELALSSAQSIHNKLCGPRGWELIIVKDKTKTIIAQAVKIQDIASYSRRDQNRPARDARVGMLPPKLAQILINLGAGPLPEESIQSVCDTPPDQPIPLKFLANQTILDPFCGSGVILQEGLLMGYPVVGSDIDKRMVSYSLENLKWLNKQSWSRLESRNAYEVLTADATRAQWPKRPAFIASEIFLGLPISQIPTETHFNRLVANESKLVSDFLSNLRPQLVSGTRLALAIPAWQYKPGYYRRLDLIDSLEKIGYNRLSFMHSSDEELIYSRPNQVVARELLVITRR